MLRWAMSKPRLWVTLAVLALIVILGVAGARHWGHNSRSPVSGPPAAIPFYQWHPPEEWKANVPTITAKAGFDVLIPNVNTANASNTTAAYLRPDGSAVYLVYDLPSDIAESSAGIYEQHIKLFERPVRAGDAMDDPSQYSNIVAQDPTGDARVCSFSNITAICVDARSPHAVAESNPAFLEFVVSTVHVQIFGGSNRTYLEEIASSLRPADG
jgi:hypothetical protein